MAIEFLDDVVFVDGKPNGFKKRIGVLPPTQTLLTLFPKETWYRLEEREKTKTVTSRSVLNTSIKTKRIIIRTGYRISPTELYGKALADAVVAYVKRKTALPDNDIHRVLVALFDEPDYINMDHPWYWKRLEPIYRQVRREWLQQFTRGVRTFWYVDIPEQEFFVEKVVYRKTGKPVPASGSASDWTEDYDPPYLQEWVTQGLYTMSTFELVTNNNLQEGQLKELYIHPLDILS